MNATTNFGYDNLFVIDEREDEVVTIAELRTRLKLRAVTDNTPAMFNGSIVAATAAQDLAAKMIAYDILVYKKFDAYDDAKTYLLEMANDRVRRASESLQTALARLEKVSSQ